MHCANIQLAAGKTCTLSCCVKTGTGSEYWQYAAGALVAEKAYSSITVTIDYSYNVNTAYFDGIQLYKENFGSSYTYNDDGEVTSVEDLQKQTTTYEYNANGDLAKIIQNNKAKMTYEYDDYHNVIKATTATGIVYEFTYDEWGNNISVSIVNGTSKITSTAQYSADGNILVSTTDALAKITQYGYNVDTNVLEWVQYPEDTEATRTEYTYDSMYRLASATADVDTGYSLDADYAYVNDLLTSIETNSTTYNFIYGDYDQISRITIGTWTLADYEYTDSKNRYLQELAYGNGDYVIYSYDDYGRVIEELWQDGDTVTYQYDNSGALATVTDSATGITTTYYYDLTDRLMKYVESGTGYNHSVGYEYDTLNNLTQLVETINGVEHTTSYTYDQDNRLIQTTYNDLTGGIDIKELVEYDRFGRLNTTEILQDNRTVVYSWPSYANGKTANTSTTRLTNLISGSETGYSIDCHYQHDNNGNITIYVVRLEYEYGTDSYLNTLTRRGTSFYHYDTANQLVREDTTWLGKTFVWTYDNAGNITSRTEYAYTTGELGTPLDVVTYEYGDLDWGDLLTSYDGKTITYDRIGNPLTDGTWTYTWEHGRELASMSDGTTTWTYIYDANGMRTSRSNGSATYNYVYNGSQLVQMTIGNDTLYFTYGVLGPTTVTWNGTTYYYALNGQGDVVGIFDVEGNLVVIYNWDNAWGYNPEPEGSMANTLGILNPLRYRGYVYDHETGLYYLQSRYYNPEWGRFINADGATSTGQGLLGNNMFAYCLNNPVNGCDPCGTCFHRLDFWNDCDKCGGKSIGDKWEDVTSWCADAYETITSVHQQQMQLETQIIMQQNEIIADAAAATWDAYMWSYNQQQEAQLQQAIATQDFVVDRFSTPEKTKNTFAACAVACEGISLATTIYPPVSKGFAIAGYILGGIAVAIDIYMED